MLDAVLATMTASAALGPFYGASAERPRSLAITELLPRTESCVRPLAALCCLHSYIYSFKKAIKQL